MDRLHCERQSSVGEEAQDPSTMALNNIKRPDLCVQYKHVAPPKSPYATNTGLSGLVNQSMPLVAMFLRNKFIAWFALIQSVHYFFNTDPEEARAAAASNKGAMDQPPIMKVLLSVVGLLVCYMNLVIPQPPMAPPKGKAKISVAPSEPNVV